VDSVKLTGEIPQQLTEIVNFAHVLKLQLQCII